MKRVFHLILLLLFYSLVQPLGVAIGWAILEFSQPVFTVVASSLAGGTFMYIGASDVVEEEFNGRRHKTKCCCYMLGVGVIAGISLLSQALLLDHSQ